MFTIWSLISLVYYLVLGSVQWVKENIFLQNTASSGNEMDQFQGVKTKQYVEKCFVELNSRLG